MRQNLINLIQTKHTHADIQMVTSTRTHIRNYPYKGINIAVKSNSNGLFVFSFHDFKILANSVSFDYESYSMYVERKLKILIYPSINFRRSGNAIYVYIRNDSNLTDDKFCFNLFNTIISEFQTAMNDIEGVVLNYLKL